MSAIAITASGVFASSTATRAMGIAGVAITQGQPLYLDTATATLKLADADAASPAFTVAGISLNAAAIGQPVDYVIQDTSFTLGATILAGDTLWLSPTAGGITKTVGDLTTGVNVVVLGVMSSTTTAIVNFIQGGVRA